VAEIPILDTDQLKCVGDLRPGSAEPPSGVARPVPVDVAGVEAVVWRAEDGSLGVVARACPHLDWDLSEARIVGTELVCPGHGWSITCNGRVFKRNEFGRADDKGTTPHWCARERDGRIWVEIGPTSDPTSALGGEL
jgi:phenylpropionate dioxygenase-like ring-hydroxylating dioxygenase large terminal subunit